MSGGATLRAALLAAGLAAATTASAVELRTLDGGHVSLETVVLAPAGTGLAPPHASAARIAYAWTVRDGAGRQFSGLLTGADTFRQSAPLLLQNPVDGEIHLIYSALHEGTRDLMLRTWLGQAWSDPAWLAGESDADDVEPQGAFTARGELVLSWMRRQGTDERFLVQYGVMDATGMALLSAYLDAGRPSLYTLPVDGDVRLRTGVAHVAIDEADDAALIFLAEADAEEVGVLQLDLRALRTIIGGGSFAPVPVNFLQVVSMGNGLGSLGDRLAQTGHVVATWRAELLGGEAYYWFDDDRMLGVAFRAGKASKLVSVARPDDEITAHAVILARLRLALGRIQVELAPLLARREAGAQRRVR